MVSSGAGAGESDRVRVERSVELPVDLETASVYGATTSAAAVALGDLKGVRRDRGGLEIHVASSALVGLKTSFDRAIDYPYGCTEQLTSRILPLVVLPEMARLFGARMPAKIEDVVDGAVGELFAHQRGSGGFGYWEDDDDAVPWLSTYAMLAIETAAKKGYFVPKGARDRGVDYLRQLLLDQTQARRGRTRAERAPRLHRPAVAPTATPTTPRPRSGSGRREEAQRHAYATLAFAADVLASIGQSDPGTLNRLFDARAHHPLFTQALLLHAMATAHMPRPPRSTCSAARKVSSSRVRVDGRLGLRRRGRRPLRGTPRLVLAHAPLLVLRALVAASPASPSPASQKDSLPQRLARGLLDHRVDGAWRSTQENVWALLALDDYRRAQEAVSPSFDARVFLGDERIGEAAVPTGWSTRRSRRSPI